MLFIKRDRNKKQRKFKRYQSRFPKWDMGFQEKANKLQNFGTLEQNLDFQDTAAKKTLKTA